MRSGGTPKKQAPRPSSTAVWRISSEAIAASMCQYGTFHGTPAGLPLRRRVPALSGAA